MREISEPEEIESEDELQDENTNINDAAMLLGNLSAETNPMVQELESNIEEYIRMIDQLTITEDVLTDEGIIEMVLDEFHEEEEDDDYYDDDDDDDPPPPPITITEAIEALEKVIRFQESLDIGNRFDENKLIML